MEQYPKTMYFYNGKLYEMDEIKFKEEQVYRMGNYTTNKSYTLPDGTVVKYGVEVVDVYDLKTLQELKLTKNGSHTKNVLILPNGEIREIDVNFSRLHSLSALSYDDHKNEEWIGKCIVIKAANGKDSVVYDLENGTELFTIDKKYCDALTPINKDMCVAFYHDMSDWDEFPSYGNDSEYVLYYKGKIILSSSRYISAD